LRIKNKISRIAECKETKLKKKDKVVSKPLGKRVEEKEDKTMGRRGSHRTGDGGFGPRKAARQGATEKREMKKVNGEGSPDLRREE